jgi:hypothetical protein
MDNEAFLGKGLGATTTGFAFYRDFANRDNSALSFQNLDRIDITRSASLVSHAKDCPCRHRRVPLTVWWMNGIQQSVGPVEKVQFSLADSFDKPGEFDDRLPSDWCFSTGPVVCWRVSRIDELLGLSRRAGLARDTSNSS